MNYSTQIIREAKAMGYDPMIAIREYTALEVKYASNKFSPEQKAKDRAFKEQFQRLYENGKM